MTDTKGGESLDIVVVGAGAAGLMAATAAGRAVPGLRVVVLESAARPGAKILVSGGGRCNVTHDVVDETAFSGSSRPAIRKVLGRFGVEDTIAYFREQGVTLVREETGKLFPSTNRAASVLDALLGAARSAGAELRHPCRVETIVAEAEGFVVAGAWGTLRARRIILTTGGRSLPKSGSDGHGLVLARGLGHSVTPRVLPALVPLVLAESSVLRTLPGVATPARLDVLTRTGKRLASFEGPLLCTHFGVSGPVVLDASRHVLHAKADDEHASAVVSFAPGETEDSLDARLRSSGHATAAGVLAALMPERLAKALALAAGAPPATAARDLLRDVRRGLVQVTIAHVLPVTGPRGWAHAEVTAGGVPLAEIRLDTMESRRAPGLHLAGELCDVDGLVGGYNYQWAFASGHVAGSAAAMAAPG